MSEEKQKLYTGWLKGTIAAIKKFSFYPPGHPAQATAIETPFDFLQSILNSQGRLVVSVMENRFVINEDTVPEDFTHNNFYSLFKSGAIKSIEIRPEITSEEFKTFLNYYAKKMTDRFYQKTLEEFINENGINGVFVNQLHYVAVSQKQEVISKTEKLRIDLKAQVAQSLKDNPQILRDILFGGELSPRELKDKYQLDVPLDKIAAVVQEEVIQMSDQDILNLAASKIKKELEKTLSQEGQKKEELEALLHLMQSQELKTLFPRLEEVLSRYGLVNRAVLKKGIGERWSKGEKIVEQINFWLNAQSLEKVQTQQLVNLAENLLGLHDQDVSGFMIEKLVASLESEREVARQVAGLLLEHILSKAQAQNREFELNLIQETVLEDIKDLKIRESAYQELARVGARIAIALIKRKKYQDLRETLLAVRSRCHKEVTFSADIQKASLEFMAEVGNSEIARQLISDWEQNPDSELGRTVESILRLLETERVVEELFLHLERQDQSCQTRIAGLLVHLQDGTLKHIESVINGRLHPSAGPASATLNADTRVLKSLIQVLGQIEDPGAVNLLGKLKNDLDTGIRMDVVKALSHHPLPAAKAAIYLLLKDHDPGVRKEVIEAAVTNPDSRAAAALINHFAEDRSDRRLVCSALAKIGGEKVVDFFVCVLTGQSRTDFNLSGKVDEESRLFALNYLARHLNSDVLIQLQNYLETQKKHLLSVFKRDPLESSIARLVQGSVSKSGLPIQR
ncbi:MAG: hypothetical protein A2Z27_02530 [candidate division Zixibacteria bacterium RBG_16_50_21]|nr:MAG: hypothetical protein A2Z27_02530 [candidate division Zixibacteria bacterium RBG_16_50_21]